MENQLIIASGNRDKVKEIKEICSDGTIPFSICSLADIWDSVPDIPETGKTFLENSTMKARWVQERKGGWVLADDSGLQVDYINGAPGIYSARFAGEHGNHAKNIKKLLRELRGVELKYRGAQFVCAMVLLGDGGYMRHAEGICRGHIGFEPVGHDGFGYDPIFLPDGFSKTFAELNSDEKNVISHRGLALSAMREIFYDISL